MTSRDFAYWLQGFLEVSNPTHIGENETTIIKNHLNMVFKHEIDPSHGDKKHQEELSKIHQGSSLPISDEMRRVLQSGIIEAKFNC